MARKMTAEESEVLERLEAWVERFYAWTTTYYGDRLRISDKEIDRARDDYREIKKELVAESKRVASNEAEERWYRRPMLKAAVALRVPTNASAEKQHTALFVARSDLETAIDRMKAAFGKK